MGSGSGDGGQVSGGTLAYDPQSLLRQGPKGMDGIDIYLPGFWRTCGRGIKHEIILGMTKVRFLSLKFIQNIQILWNSELFTCDKSQILTMTMLKPILRLLYICNLFIL